MRIGEVTERSGVPTKTLRYWEEVGVLAPSRRSEAGYRDYDPEVFERISFIRAGQSIGLTLGELREIISFRDDGDPPCDHVLGLLRRHRAEIDDRIAELQRTRKDLDRLVRRASKLRPEDCRDEQVCHIIAPTA